jgi:hypothetical protein
MDTTYDRSDTNGMRKHISFCASDEQIMQIIRSCFGAKHGAFLYPLTVEKFNCLLVFEERREESLCIWVEKWVCPPCPKIPFPGDVVGSLYTRNYNWSHLEREEEKLEKSICTWLSTWINSNKDCV